VGGSAVTHESKTYIAAWWTQGDTPKDEPWYVWRYEGACDTPQPTPDPEPTGQPSPDPTDQPTQEPSPEPDPTGNPTTPPPAAYKPQITYIDRPAGYPSATQIAADEKALAAKAGESQDLVPLIRKALEVLPDSEVEKITPQRAANPANVKLLESVLDEQRFNELFPVRHTAYAYENLLKAVGKFPAYCATYDDGRDSEAICRKLLATTFAHFVQETGANSPAMTPAVAAQDPEHNNPILATMPQEQVIPTHRQALWYLREIGYTEEASRNIYTECFLSAGSPIFSIFTPCGKDEQGSFYSYFGRGAKQLSWNYNYGQFSKSLYGDPNVLLDDPARVADTWLNFASAIWFAVYPQSPKPPMTWVVDGTWEPNEVDRGNNMSPGFGATIDIINGGLECHGGGEEKRQVQNRIAAYKAFAQELNVPIPASEKLGCADTKGFVVGSAAATKTNLDMDWSWNPNTASGKSFKCQLVTYQTPFSLANEGDYQACVDYFFRGQVVFDGKVVIDNTK
jgi:chitodextrinase